MQIENLTNFRIYQDSAILSKELELVKILGPTYVVLKPSIVCGYDSSGISQFGNK